MKRTILIFTDGACSNNGRANASGGWAAILVNPEGECLKIASKLTGDEITNNRAELTAVIEGLSALKRPADVILTTDSKYVADGATTWLASWKRNGWKTATGKPVKNVDLWQRLDALLQIHIVRFDWVRGHSGHPENELADTLAQAACYGQVVRERG
ncbi:ribonuclease HI [Halomonas heilongjiangensis]|uniref:Ribonuclease H n=2 Tax=Halomonas heilongjiangensis TaxID=1387883 RepID=A0A2N7TTH3_9GAMM|nr:ribonuclease HI [Halomonas heilongjiangensis]PMR71438.1 ribonuclease HI [Halomonas heilongjiangensis]PXX88726.1 ribonuclease HI [Halomonas heilongjiangensis]